MKILNYGSLNIDHVYQMPAFVKAGETLSATDCQLHTGGKGLNQSVALARAGAEVFHGGKIGADGLELKAFLEEAGADCRFLRIDPEIPTGHAIIQVVASGENCILIYGGTNTRITEAEIDETLENFGPGDLLLLQNEISNVNYLIHRANEKGMITVLNPSPITAELLTYDGLSLLDWMIVNQGEAEALAGLYGHLRGYIEDFNSEAVGSMIRALDHYSFPGREQERFNELKRAYEAMDWVAMMSIFDENGEENG